MYSTSKLFYTSYPKSTSYYSLILVFGVSENHQPGHVVHLGQKGAATESGFLERLGGSGPCPFCRAGGPGVSGNRAGGGSRT